MSENILATCIGTICGRNHGLFKLVLPRSLSSAFKRDVASAVKAANGTPVIIGHEDGEYSAGDAIGFRTLEDGSANRAIVLIATDGETAELKSLETFRDLLSEGMPGGLNEFAPAILTIKEIALEATRIVTNTANVSLDSRSLASTLSEVLAYLANAYREAGNDEKRWTEAYWLHAYLLVGRLVWASRLWPTGAPKLERDVVFAAAGLPKPDGAEKYAEKNNSAKYANTVRNSWSSQEDINQSLMEIDKIDGGGTGNHPLLTVVWSEFPTTRANLGHPLLAVAYHGSEDGNAGDWLNGWASTTEKAFFREQTLQPPEYELCVRSEDEKVTALRPLGWYGLDFILPPGSANIRNDGRVSLGKLQLRIVTDGNVDAQLEMLTLAVQPASACVPVKTSWTLSDGHLFVDFELARRVSKSGGKWRERPFTLAVCGPRTAPEWGFLNSLNLRLFAPHPVRPTAFALETERGRGKCRPSFATDGRYKVDSEIGALDIDDREKEAALMKLRQGFISGKLVVVGERREPYWIGGEKLKQDTQGDTDGFIRCYALTPLPEDAEINIGKYRINVQPPQVDRGQVNPIFASIRGEPVMPVDDDLREELLSDPRGVLESWYQQKCISSVPDEDVKNSLGTCVLESSGRGLARLTWNSQIGTFSDIREPVNLSFPTDQATSSEAEAFVQAFVSLDLGSLAGTQRVTAWPSALDLRGLSAERVDGYLSCFGDLLNTMGKERNNGWLAYPFSALLYDQTRGEAEGFLLSSLHPLKLAWAWSVQLASEEVARSDVYRRVSSSFLRFVDGEPLPLVGPAIQGSNRWIATGLAPGPQEFFSGWTLLAGNRIREGRAGKPMRLMGFDLPFGTPSGLDPGGVAAALRDYMRVYPASPQLRIGLAPPLGGERYVETDEAIVSASGDLIAQHGSNLPGGIRILDASERRGRPPSPVRVLQKILPKALVSKDPTGHPPFEWSTESSRGEASKVDIQFIEDTVVEVRAENITEGSDTIGTSGPALPFTRYRLWCQDELTDGVSSFPLGLQEGSFQKLPSFARSLGQFESHRVSGGGLKLASELRLGSSLLGDHSGWTITGNRHLDPAVLSSQLRTAPGQMALWEWRPAFLSRQHQRGNFASVSSTHPYTVLARLSSALTDEVSSVLHKCGMKSGSDDVRDVVSSLGMRGVGLSSLLTMGHTQSLGAIGFSLAFKALRIWESRGEPDEVRCVVPMDAVYPLLDVLGIGARNADDQRRADLLLMSTRLSENTPCSLGLHPVEIKLRSSEPGFFPGPGTSALGDPLEQLESTYHVLEQLCENHKHEGHVLSLPSGALATLLEAAFSLRPLSSPRQTSLETRILCAVASGRVSPYATSGTLLWFQVGATGAGGSRYEQRSAGDNLPSQVFANPATLDDLVTRDELGQVVASIIEADHGTKGQDDVGRKQDSKQERDKPLGGHDLLQDVQHQPKQHVTTDNSAIQPPDKGKAQPSGHDSYQAPTDSAKDAMPNGISILVGDAPVGVSTRPVYFRPSDTALNQLNVGVVGDLGTGKTQFLKSLVYQLSRSATSNRGQEPRVFIFDYKRDYSEGEFPSALGAKVLDPSKRPLPINFFALGVNPNDAVAVQLERVRRANFFCDLLRRISGIGQVQRNDLYSTVMTAYKACAHGHAPSIDDVFGYYASLGKNDSVISVLTLMKDLMIFEPNSKNTTTFKDLFDTSVVLNLSGLSGAGQDIVDIVATMFLDNLYTDYMKSLPKEPFIDGADGVSRRKVDSFVLIDEAHHAMGRDFDVLMKIMLEGREFGMGVILSSQFLSHFDAKKHNWSEALSTWVVHNVRNASTKQFERIGFRGDIPRMVQDVAGLKTHWAYYRCVNGYDEGILIKGKPFYMLQQN